MKLMKKIRQTHRKARWMLLAMLVWTLLGGQQTKAEDRYWAVGTAVPGGIQELTAFPGNKFKYTGRLIEGGTLRFRNMEVPKGITLRYLKPSYENAYAVTGALPFTMTRDSSNCEWIVPLTEDVYRITIDMSAKTLTGELFRPWNELFILGGATECGWVTYTFLPFTRNENEVCTWEWTGELRERPEFGEPRRFKFNGQNAWDPKVLHPFTQDEDILQSTQLLTGGSGDNKWSVRQEGIYHIRVDVFRETVQAEYLGPAATQTEAPTGIEETVFTPTTGNQGQLSTSDTSADGFMYDLSGRRITNNKHQKGIFITDGKKILKR